MGYQPQGVASMLPLSALLELAGFILFFGTVGRYRGAPAAPEPGRITA